MIKSLSKSVVLLFLYDFAVIFCSTLIWYKYFNLPENYFGSVTIITLLVGMFTLFLKDNYKIREFNITLKNIYLLFEAVVFAIFPASVILFIFNRDLNSIYFVLFNLVTIWLLLLLYRIIFHYYLFNLKRVKNVLIIGGGHQAEVVSELINEKYALKMNVIEHFEYTNCDNNYEIINNYLSCLSEKIKKLKVDIIITAKDEPFDELFILSLISKDIIPKNVKIYRMYDFYELATGKYFIDEHSINELIFYFNEHKSKLYDFCKRIFDIISAAIILTVTLPITGYIALRVKLTDGKSPFFTQERVGKNGKIFKAYKLRTMYDNDFIPKDNKKVGYVENQDEDDRVIPFCKFVRKARFDEIFQMINILKGEMSIVGPRAEWTKVVEVYQKEVKGYPLRMMVNTAWTGWAQINQGYCFASDNEAIKLQYDLYYIKHRNLLWDISILIKAIFLAVGGRHA